MPGMLWQTLVKGRFSCDIPRGSIVCKEGTLLLQAQVSS